MTPAWPRTFKRPQVRQVGATWTTVISTTEGRERRNTITVLRWAAGPPRAIQPRFVRAREIRVGRAELWEYEAEVPSCGLAGDDDASPAPEGEEGDDPEVGGNGVEDPAPPPEVEPGEAAVDVGGTAGSGSVGTVGVVVGTEGVGGTVVVVGSVTGRLGTVIVVVGRSTPGASAAPAA